MRLIKALTSTQMRNISLVSNADIEQIARFNKKFVPEPRMGDPAFLEWKYRSKKPDGLAITEHFGLSNDQSEIVATMSV
ncbi:MAG: hypothetical protein IH942_06195, partial [Acidobacteria bacterium]|nr:hypothetical protein [Acidobacteriota bacterium]